MWGDKVRAGADYVPRARPGPVARLRRARARPQLVLFGGRSSDVIVEHDPKTYSLEEVDGVTTITTYDTRSVRNFSCPAGATTPEECGRFIHTIDLHNDVWAYDTSAPRASAHLARVPPPNPLPLAAPRHRLLSLRRQRMRQQWVGAAAPRRRLRRLPHRGVRDHGGLGAGLPRALRALCPRCPGARAPRVRARLQLPRPERLTPSPPSLACAARQNGTRPPRLRRLCAVL